MAWTIADLDAINAAIISGVVEVRFQDRTTTYRSIPDLIKAKDVVVQDLIRQGLFGTPTRQWRVIPSSGY
jgi:hypothetical protein